MELASCATSLFDLNSLIHPSGSLTDTIFILWHKSTSPHYCGLYLTTRHLCNCDVKLPHPSVWKFDTIFILYHKSTSPHYCGLYLTIRYFCNTDVKLPLPSIWKFDRIVILCHKSTWPHYREVYLTIRHSCTNALHWVFSLVFFYVIFDQDWTGSTDPCWRENNVASFLWILTVTGHWGLFEYNLYNTQF